MNKNNFILLAHPRSGSSSLVDVFNLNGVQVLSEPFNKSKSSEHYQALSTKRPDEVVEEIFKQYRGIKTLMTQLGRGNNTGLVNTYPSIILTRDNLMEAALSTRMAALTNSWSGRTARDDEPTSLDKEKVMALLNFYASEIRHFRKKCPEALHVSYEELFNEDEATRLSTAEKIFKHVGHAIQDTEATRSALDPSRKQNRAPWSETLSNWEDFRKIWETFQRHNGGKNR